MYFVLPPKTETRKASGHWLMLGGNERKKWREKRTPIFLVERFMGVLFLSFFCGCPFSVPFSALINAGRKENEERKKDTHFFSWKIYGCPFFVSFFCPFFVPDSQLKKPGDNLSAPPDCKYTGVQFSRVRNPIGRDSYLSGHSLFSIKRFKGALFFSFNKTVVTGYVSLKGW